MKLTPTKLVFVFVFVFDFFLKKENDVILL